MRKKRKKEEKIGKKRKKEEKRGKKREKEKGKKNKLKATRISLNTNFNSNFKSS